MLFLHCHLKFDILPKTVEYVDKFVCKSGFIHI